MDSDDYGLCTGMAYSLAWPWRAIRRQAGILNDFVERARALSRDLELPLQRPSPQQLAFVSHASHRKLTSFPSPAQKLAPCLPVSLA